jgi:carbohydrate diacid regulator
VGCDKIEPSNASKYPFLPLGGLMLLSSNVAEQIVDQLSKVMEQNINIMDMNGLIISSTDPVRVGTVHGGAVRIIQEHLKELIIETDDEYMGAKNGINLPIEFNNEIIGVIGLTGKSDEVRKYGQIIKKMTEVLLLDTYVREQKNIEQKAKDRFLEEWVFGRYDVNYPQEFKLRAESLGIDTQSPKRVMVFSIKDQENNPVSDLAQTDISHRLREFLRTIGDSYFFRTSTLFVCIMKEMTDGEIRVVAETISQSIKQRSPYKVFVGIDSPEPKPVKTSFRNANTALQVSLKSNQTINIYNLINFDITINSLVPKYKNAYLQDFFKNIDQKELDEYIRILRVLYLCDGSIQEASEKLFIHKNTLQYRLNKIAEVTGYDPRKISLAYLFSIAIKIYDSIKVEKE